MNHRFTARCNGREALRLDPRGFSISEMMVVLGMIAVLIALLWPMVSKARDMAARVRCASNLRQLGAAFVMYAEENDRCFPFVASRSVLPYNGAQTTPAMQDQREDWIHWRTPIELGGLKTSAIARYLRGSQSSLEQVFRCPADNIDMHQANPATVPYRYSYSMNGFMDPRGILTDASGATSLARLHKIVNPAAKILLVEESEVTINDGHWKPGNYYSGPWQVEYDRLSIRHDNVRDEDEPITSGVVLYPDKRGNACFCDGHVDFISRQFAHDPGHVVYDAK